MKLEEFEWAKKVLGIDIPMPLTHIRENYLELAKSLHPDVSKLPKIEAESKFRDVQKAYEIIEEYASAYKIDFSREEFLRQNPAARIKEQFGFDPNWGKGSSK